MAGINLAKFGLKPFVKPATEAAPVAQESQSEEAPAVAEDLEATATRAVEGAMQAVATGAEGFKAKLDKLDSLIIAGQGIDMLSLDTARAYVRDIFVEVQQNPEYDSLLVDRDVHNVMMFVQASTLVASKDIQKKQVKKEIAQTKKLNTKFDLSGFGDPTSPVEAAVDQAVTQAKSVSIKQLSALNVDSIAPKSR